MYGGPYVPPLNFLLSGIFNKKIQKFIEFQMIYE